MVSRPVTMEARSASAKALRRVEKPWYRRNAAQKNCLGRGGFWVGAHAVPMPQVIRKRTPRFSPPAQGAGKFPYHPAVPGAAGSGTRPTPLIIQDRAQAVERARVTETLVR